MTALAAHTVVNSAEGAVPTAANNFLLPNGTFFVELLAFLIILFVLYRYVVPPVQKAMGERQEMISAQIEESKQAKERLAAAQAEYDKALAEARTVAAKIRDVARAEGQAIIEDLKAKAQREADRVIERGREQLAAERDALARELRADLGRLSVELASRIVGESLADEELRQRTVDRFLTELEGQLAGGRR